jgi:predicted nuclease of predicted toxin-antitoxin system
LQFILLNVQLFPDLSRLFAKLIAPRHWTDAASADRYSHVVISDTAKRADMLLVQSKRRRA